MFIIKAIDIFYRLTKIADHESEVVKALIKFIADTAREAGVANHSYIVGGSVRDFVMGVDPKDIDIVVETKIDDDGNVKNATTLGTAIADKLGLKVQADQYGVVHIGPVAKDFIFEGQNLIGQKIEIVTARKEQYNRGGKSSHKPSEVAPGTIEDDLQRRDFTFNTLTWRLSDIDKGVEGAPVIDLLGTGRRDLDERTVMTPIDPEQTFLDDPSRMLRAVRFAIKYNFTMKPEVAEAIKRNAEEIKRMPYEPIADVFTGKILSLGKEKAMKAIELMDDLNLLKPTLEMINKSFLKNKLKDMPVGNDPDFLMFLLSYLKEYNIENFIFKFPLEFESDLMTLHKLLSHEEFASLYKKLQGNLINVNKFMKEFKVSGSAIGKLVLKAKKLLVDNPNMSIEAIEDILASEL